MCNKSFDISYLLVNLSAMFVVLDCNFLCQLSKCGPLQFLSHLYHLSLSLSYPYPLGMGITQCTPSMISLACNPKCLKVFLAAVLFCCYQSKFHQTQSAIAASFIPPGWPVPQQKAENHPHRVPLKICNQQTG